MPGKILPDNLVARLMREGKTDGQIVTYLREHENIAVTRQAISAWRRRLGERKRPMAPRAVPWKLRPEHLTSEPARVVRWHARVERGASLSHGERQRYEKALAYLRENDLVFHYDPDSEQGWFLVPRRPGIDTGVVRVPDAMARAQPPTRPTTARSTSSSSSSD